MNIEVYKCIWLYICIRYICTYTNTPGVLNRIWTKSLTAVGAKKMSWTSGDRDVKLVNFSLLQDVPETWLHLGKLYRFGSFQLKWNLSQRFRSLFPPTGAFSWLADFACDRTSWLWRRGIVRKCLGGSQCRSFVAGCEPVSWSFCNLVLRNDISPLKKRGWCAFQSCCSITSGSSSGWLGGSCTWVPGGIPWSVGHSRHRGYRRHRAIKIDAVSTCLGYWESNHLNTLRQGL